MHSFFSTALRNFEFDVIGGNECVDGRKNLVDFDMIC
jgi:hypothetical protein